MRSYLRGFSRLHSGVCGSALFGVGQCYYEQQKWAESAAAFGVMAKAFPKTDLAPQALYHQGRSLQKLKKWPEAQQAFSAQVAGYAKAKLASGAPVEVGGMGMPTGPARGRGWGRAAAQGTTRGRALRETTGGLAVPQTTPLPVTTAATRCSAKAARITSSLAMVPTVRRPTPQAARASRTTRLVRSPYPAGIYASSAAPSGSSTTCAERPG